MLRTLRPRGQNLNVYYARLVAYLSEAADYRPTTQPILSLEES